MGLVRDAYILTTNIDIAADSSTRLFFLPRMDGLSNTYFLRLTLNDAAGNLVSSNFYWLSTQPDDIDWSGSGFPDARISTYMDLRADAG